MSGAQTFGRNRRQRFTPIIVIMRAHFTAIKLMTALQVIEMMAGADANGQPVVERLQVKVDENNQCQLVKSPAFIKGLASGDIIKLNRETGEFELQQHSGNLCIRVISKGDIRPIAEQLGAEMEKLGGDLDIETPRMLVFSIHVSCGFKNIEDLLNKHMNSETAWFYGNVYNPDDGTTPLNWWNDILKPE